MFSIKRLLFVPIVWAIINIKILNVRNVRGPVSLGGLSMILGLVALVMGVVPSKNMVVRIVKVKAPFKYMLSKPLQSLKMHLIINKSYSKAEDINI